MGRQEAVKKAFTATEKPDPNEAVKSVYLGLELAEKIDELADEWNATASSVMRWLIRQGLESGKWPTMGSKAELD